MCINLPFLKKLDPIIASCIIIFSFYRLPNIISYFLACHLFNLFVRVVTENLYSRNYISKEVTSISRHCLNFLNICSCETSKIAYRDYFVNNFAFSEEVAFNIAIALCLGQSHLNHQLYEATCEFFEKKYRGAIPQTPPAKAEKAHECVIATTASKVLAQGIKACFPSQLRVLSYVTEAFISNGLSWHIKPDKYPSVSCFIIYSTNKALSHIMSKEILTCFTNGGQAVPFKHTTALVVHDIAKESYRRSIEEYCINPRFPKIKSRSLSEKSEHPHSM